MLSEEKNYRKFFNTYYEAAVRFAAHYLRDDSAAEDIAQEAFIRLHENRTAFNTPEKAKSFLYTTVKNLALNYLRHRKIEQDYLSTLDPESIERSFLHEITYQETLRLLHAAIDTLPDQTRRIILLGLDGKNNNEIAADLSISVNTVKSLKKTAYHHLRTLLGNRLILLFPFLL